MPESQAKASLSVVSMKALFVGKFYARETWQGLDIFTSRFLPHMPIEQHDLVGIVDRRGRVWISSK